MSVSLQNLLKIGQLKAHPPDAAEVQRLMAAAGRNLADARVTTISPETRFDAAYKAVMQAALAALMPRLPPGHEPAGASCDGGAGTAADDRTGAGPRDGARYGAAEMMAQK